MPLVVIEEKTQRDIQAKKKIINSIFQDILEVFKVSPKELQARYYTLTEEEFFPPIHCSENYLTIQIILFKGRTIDAKRKLYKTITHNLANSLSIAEQDILIILNEQPLENWGMNGGQAASDINLGYSISI